MFDPHDPFPGRNLDVLHERTASGRHSTTGAARTTDALGVLTGKMQNTRDGGELRLTLDDDGDWTAAVFLASGEIATDIQDTPEAALNALVAMLPRGHTTAQEDDGEQD